MALRSLAFVFAAISVSGAEQCEGPGSAQGSAGSALLQSSYGHATKSFSGPNMTLIQQQGNQLAEAAKSNSGNLQFMFCCLGLSSWFNYCVEFSGCEVPVTDSCWCVGKYQEGEEDCRTKWDWCEHVGKDSIQTNGMEEAVCVGGLEADDDLFEYLELKRKEVAAMTQAAEIAREQVGFVNFALRRFQGARQYICCACSDKSRIESMAQGDLEQAQVQAGHVGDDGEGAQAFDGRSLRFAGVLDLRWSSARLDVVIGGPETIRVGSYASSIRSDSHSSSLCL
ncbi:hypothetical protein AK812_SmicGene30066 [Symbiodinium microadriaticum]|uniref:Uncharacterized protein n=1 Tax=Symbiodinium microadriaticum TaxID=2951 RepID=A0A1Q9D0C1_SYMMI|nr:hypothetical protein AK812_SmicGene30066 [Symbiodinium microadriaticum]